MIIDAVIAGAGPGGLSAALCLGRAGRQALVADGGPWRNVSSGTLHNILSRDGVTPAELRASALAQLRSYPSVKVQPVSAESVDGESGRFRVTLSDGRAVQARRVVLATGVEDVLPDIRGLAERWGQGVVHCPYCHGWERIGLPLGVLALDEWAVHHAVHVARFSDDVTLYTNGDFPITADQREFLRARKVAVRAETLARLDGPGASLERLVFTDGSTAPCQSLFCFAPTRQRSDLAARLGCRLLDDGKVEVNQFGQTTRAGVYAVGDMARTAANPFGAQQVVMAAAEGVMAGVVIDQELLYND
jgi:thioredoxin reductase